MSTHLSLADLIDSVRARIKRRLSNLDPVYYTLHDAAVDEDLIEEINFLRLRAVEQPAAKKD